MAERMIKRRASNLARSPSAESSESAIDVHMGKSIKKKPKKPKERWLLTRKTWRYMADAGKKLIPDGAQNKPEDIPKIEAYFQEVCKKEPKFLLWRKNSYPGALNLGKKRRDRLKGGSCRKACSADEMHIKPERPKDLAIHSISGGRFDLQKMKYDFLNKPHSPSNQRTFTKSTESFIQTPTGKQREQLHNEDIEEKRQLANMLEQYLKGTTSSSKSDFNIQELIDKLQKHLTIDSRVIQSSPASVPSTSCERVYFDGDHLQKNLSETLSRYFGQYSNRDKVISDMLTNRKALEKLYFELRKTKGFRSRSSDRYSGQNQSWSPSLLRNYSTTDNNSTATSSVPPLPLIEIQKPTVEVQYVCHGIQTISIPENDLLKIEEEYRKMVVEREDDINENFRQGYRRRSSVDNDDISQSVSDTIKRYLRMARKKSVDSDKADRFKRVNYDRNLRNIKAKGEITKPGDDDGLNKGCQTNDDWILIYKDLKFDELPVSDIESRLSSARSSIDIGVVEEKASPTSSGQKSSGHSFLSNLLHGKHGHDKFASAASATGSMQKSKSSSSVHHGKSKLTKKSLFKSRSKSQTRSSVTASNWTPQGSCIWGSIAGKQVSLGESSLLQLTQVERKVLQKVALAKLQALNLGVTVTLPTDNVTPVASKPKRKTYLLKRKALTTGIFDTNRKDIEKEKEVSTSGGLVFGIPLSQCVENDRLSRIASSGGASSFRSRDELSTFDAPSMGRHPSRASFSSLVDADRPEEKGSCDSLLSRERIVGSVPGLLNTLSCSSTTDLATTGEDEPAVPNILSACIKHLETHGLHTLGLFRVSTSKKRIRQLRDDFDCGKEIALEDDQCPHDVATLIKEYLRELPDPLLCRDLYHAFVQTQKIRNRRLQLEALQYLIQLLPPSNRDTLYTLLKFLANVAKYSNDHRNILGEEVLGNKMDANNLATVFAPNILHCIKHGSKDNSGDRPEDRTDVINVVRTLIEHNKELFTISSDLLDEVYIHMMDSYPEVLDQLLSKKEDGIAAEESLDDLDSESISATWTPSKSSELELVSHKTSYDADNHEIPTEPRKTYSREEFLHESAATGGPDVAMKIRHKDRYRDKSSKKKRDESDIRRKREEDVGITMKARSSSIESSGYQEAGQAPDRRKSSPYLLDSSGVITASLTIPVQTGNQSLPLSIEDGIPYIEDGNYICSSDGKQQMTIDLLKSPSVPPRRRQRSISGSDSSVTSNVHPITGSISIGQQGYDSAMGSSATFSTPPHNTTPSSVSSSIADAGALSSPPSWASTPPTSPDSQNTSVNYIPDDISGKVVRTVPTQKQSNVVVKDSPILQKITFTSTSELHQIQKAKQVETKLNQKDNLQKSPSSPAFTMEKPQERDYSKFSASITSIGNAVLRSKTADFERISKSDVKSEVKSASTPTTQKTVAPEKKKYAKRRYTDSRHQTRHIPDLETLEASNSNLPATKADKSGPVYKRREIISSVPSR